MDPGNDHDPVELELVFASTADFLERLGSRMSPEGFFLETDKPLPEGKTLAFSAHLENGTPLVRGQGEVAWVQGHDPGPEGMAIRMLELDQQSRQMVGSVVGFQKGRGAYSFHLPAGQWPPPWDQKKQQEPLVEAVEFEAVLEEEPREESGSSPQGQEDVVFAAIVEEAGDEAQGHIPLAAEHDQERVTEAKPVEPEEGAESSPQPQTRRIRPQVLALAGLIAILGTTGVYFSGTWWSSDAEPGSEPVFVPPDSVREVIDIPPTPSRPDVDSPAQVPSSVQDHEGDENGPAPESQLSSMTQIRLITWKTVDRGTQVTLWGNGRAVTERCSTYDLGSRLLVKVRGIDWPFREPVLDVSSPELLRIRSGFHPRPDGNELHIVLDLADPEAQILELEAEGEGLLLTVGRPPPED